MDWLLDSFCSLCWPSAYQPALGQRREQAGGSGWYSLASPYSHYVIITCRSIAYILKIQRQRANGNALYKGFKVNIDRLPVVVDLPTDVSWDSLSDIKQLKVSAAYKILKATWNEETVVVKLLLDEAEGPRHGAAREIDREIGILSRIRHPNIIRLLGSGYAPGRFAILEYMGGGTLSSRLNYTYRDHSRYGVTKLPQDQAMEYALTLARALAYMHEQWHPGIRLMHRDLKSDNIAFTADGELKLINFGLCELMRRPLQEDVALPLAGGVGSWRYMAPEVLLNLPYNHKIDVYSYTMILYHFLTGRHPIPNDMNRTMLIEVVIKGSWRPRLRPQWPVKLSRLVARGWDAQSRIRPNFLDILTDLFSLRDSGIDFDAPLVGGTTHGLVSYVE